MEYVRIYILFDLGHLFSLLPVFPPGLLFKGGGGIATHTKIWPEFGRRVERKKKFLAGFVTQISRCKSLGFKVQANPRGKGWECFPSSRSEISFRQKNFYVPQHTILETMI